MVSKYVLFTCFVKDKLCNIILFLLILFGNKYKVTYNSLFTKPVVLYIYLKVTQRRVMNVFCCFQWQMMAIGYIGPMKTTHVTFSVANRITRKTNRFRLCVFSSRAATISCFYRTTGNRINVNRRTGLQKYYHKAVENIIIY